MTDIVLGITLKADGSGFVGQVKLGQDSLDKLGATAKRAGDRGAASIDRMGTRLAALRRVALTAISGFVGFNTVERIIGQVRAEILATEKANANLNAVLKATEGAAGLSADEIGRLADELERTTLFDDNEIKQGAAVLLTFRNVAGDAFGETLSLAADLAALMGGDFQGAVLQLGKAIQDPVEGLTALRRSGVSFSAAQRDVIKSLYETGRQGEATRIILDELARQVGGVAKSQVVGLTGATNDLEDAWGDLLKTFMNTRGFDVTLSALEAIAVKTRELIDTGPQLQDLLDILTFSPLASILGGTNFSFSDLIPDSAFQRSAEEARAEVERLAAALEELRNLRGRQVAPAAIAALERRLQAARILAGQIASDAADQARFVGRRRGAGGSATGDDDPPGVPDQDELARLERRNKLLADWKVELAIAYEQPWFDAMELGDERIKEMNQAIRDALDADKQLGEALRQELLTPQEEYNESLATYNRLLASGAIGQETWRRAVEKAGEELEAANENSIALQETLRDAGTTIAQDFEDAIVAGGNLRDVLGGLENDFIRILTRIAFTKPFETLVGGLADNLGSWLGDILGGMPGDRSTGGAGAHPVIGHRGGKVGSLPRHDVSLTAFAGAPRLHDGGMLGPGEVPIVGKRGEVIGWPEQMRRAFGGGDTEVHIHNHTGQPVRSGERQGADGRRMIEVTIGEAGARDIRTHGPMAQQLETTYGLGRRGVVR